MAGQLGAKLTGLGVPNLDGPIIRARQENRAIILVEERIAPQLVDGASMADVRIEVLFSVRHRALMDCAVFSCSEVVHVLLTVNGEVN